MVEKIKILDLISLSIKPPKLKVLRSAKLEKKGAPGKDEQNRTLPKRFSLGAKPDRVKPQNYLS